MQLLSISIIILFLPGAMGLTSTCGDPDDSCMDSENWKQCRNLEINGCKNIQVLDSCPLQFTCGDDDDENLQQINEDAIALNPSVNEDIIGEKPSACVKLYVYGNSKCTGPAIRVKSFPTWIHPGSACYHDATMHHYSVRDQYCDPRTMNYHETVIVGSSTCHLKPWYEGGKKYDFVFTTDSCIEGISLKGCYQGPCDSDDIEMDEIPVHHALAKVY